MLTCGSRVKYLKYWKQPGGLSLSWRKSLKVQHWDNKIRFVKQNYNLCEWV